MRMAAAMDMSAQSTLTIGTLGRLAHLGMYQMRGI